MSNHKIKTVALYLPQFHRVKENDEWWGDGYTEWTAVKAAKPLFEGHYQPHIPLDENYYNLMDKKTMEWQANLMHQYGIDGMAIYHYYFKNGRKILEKPAENLLAWKDIDMPFCFYWANESWARSWSAIRNKNAWNDLKEKERDNPNGENGVLLLQEYGGEKDWEEHFIYLAQFFEDERYIKIDDRPVLLVYKPDDIGCFHKMKEAWKLMSEERGIQEPFYIGGNTTSALYDAWLRHNSVKGHFNPEKGVYTIDYSDNCREQLKDVLQTPEGTLFCGLTAFDDSPRRGSKATVTENIDSGIFYKYMKELYYISKQRGNEILFVNAWNEWGEGMHLEPDEHFGYEFLDALKRAEEDYLSISMEEIQEIEELLKENG